MSQSLPNVEDSVDNGNKRIRRSLRILNREIQECDTKNIKSGLNDADKSDLESDLESYLDASEPESDIFDLIKNDDDDFWFAEILKNKLKELFPSARDDAINSEYKEQSLDEFIEMGNRRPNTKGTGRYKLTAKRNKILVIYFGNKSTKRKYDINLLLEYLKRLFLLDVDYKDCFDAIDVFTKTFTSNNLEYDIDSKVENKRKKTKHGSVDVSSLLDVLIHEAQEPYYTVVGLFENMLRKNGAEVFGSWNNRVCCVSIPLLPRQFLLSTTAHCILHTFGLDYNNTERCIMNVANNGGNSLFLCMENLEKLKHLHEESEFTSKHYVTHNFYYYYYARLRCAFKSDNDDFKKVSNWLANVSRFYNYRVKYLLDICDFYSPQGQYAIFDSQGGEITHLKSKTITVKKVREIIGTATTIKKGKKAVFDFIVDCDQSKLPGESDSGGSGDY